ncbi:hypothetical protein [Sedimentibacter saalensis]|uniref:Tfp pilus assembly protein PilO n=1 Tax=Sedimentibacter saalensis TaxID=130788 RepID=A0A562J2G1_9FIRM|nr:hypothetical protein [Sedimentibacter saalensis]TWH77044.1 hypothetical protein LY60_03520 [Sedimentibacter saalensis]
MKNNKYIKIVIFIALSMILLFTAKDNVSAAYSVFSLTDDEHTKIIADYENMCENIKNKKMYEERLRDICDEANNINIISNIRQEQILTTLNEYLSSCSIEASSIDFLEYSNLNNMDAKISKENEKDRIVSAAVTISFTASYNNMLKFVDEIQRGRTTVAISSVRVVMNDNDEVFGTIKLVFYALKIDEDYE